MVQAIIDISLRANHVLNLIKAKHGLRTKSESINLMAREYEENVLEPQLRPEYVRKLKRIRKQKPIPVKDIDAYFDSMKK